MGKYENGNFTRKTILDISKKLFLEKGFHETSNEDICRAAHVNRSAIRYHFRDKENLRYEVLWQIFMEYRAIASRYCQEEGLQMTTAIYLSWCHVIKDAKVRRFHVDYSRDYPVYIPNKTLPSYYRLLYQHTLGEIWPMDKLSSLSFSSIYGHLMGQMQLVDSQPEQYSGKELFLHGMKVCLIGWDIPEEKGKEFWQKMVDAIEKVPETALEEFKKI